MKTWAKIAIGCLVVLVVLCIVLAVVFFFAGTWLKSKLGGFFGGAYETGKNISEIQKLDQQYPFNAPSDGVMTEERLQAFLTACQTIKAVADPLRESLKDLNQGDQAKMEDANKAMAATSAITQAMKEGLQQAQMSPSEFRWLEQTAYAALEEGAGSGTTGGEIQGQAGFEAMTNASLEILESQKNDPSLSAEQKQALQEQIDQLKSQMAPTPVASGEGSPNAALAEKYRQQLEEYDVREFAAMGMSGN